MSDALKPCPFCGGEALVSDARRKVPACLDCGATGGEFLAIAEAIAAWNRRASMPEGWRDVVRQAGSNPAGGHL